MIKRAYRAFKYNPVKIVGVSLFAGVVLSLAGSLFIGIPAISIAIAAMISVSMAMIYLRAYHDEEVYCKQVFDTFKDGKTAKHVLGGMAWMYLWIFIWSLIPVAGWVIAIIRGYEYRLTPYILMTEPEIPACDAIKVSKERTEGYKGKMFLTDVILGILGIVAAILMIIPVIGWIAFVVLAFTISALSGLAAAAYYEEIMNPTPVEEPVYTYTQNTYSSAPAAETSIFCPECGTKNNATAKFCCGCGYKFAQAQMDIVPAVEQEPVFKPFESEFKVKDTDTQDE